MVMLDVGEEDCLVMFLSDLGKSGNSLSLSL